MTKLIGVMLCCALVLVGQRPQQEAVGSPGTKTVEAMTNKPMDRDELLQMLKQGKEMGFVTGDLPEDPVELEEFLQSILSNMVVNVAVGQTGARHESGWQQFILRSDPEGPWNETTDRRLEIFLEGPEWTELFRNVLGCTGAEPPARGEILTDHRERQRIWFQERLPDYPMLSRIYDTYIDVAYDQREVHQLRDECLRLRTSTTNVLALRALDKIFASCEEAISAGTGLRLVSD